MTISDEITPPIAEQWRLAVAHAGVDEADVHLLSITGRAGPDAPKAATYPAGNPLVEESDDLIRGPALVEANTAEVINKHRVAIYADFDEGDPVELAIVGGKLRHELRHVEQRMSAASSDLFALDELADQIAKWKAGGLAGSSVLYNLKPIEIDANAASAKFLREYHAAVIADILQGEDASLARSNTPPGSLEDLPAKTVAFMFLFREIAEDPARALDGMTFESRLSLLSPLAAAQWRALAGAP